MNEIINQYELTEPFQNRNAGFSRWTYARKKGEEYFLKEFLDPVYPTESSLSLELRQKRIRDCEEFERKQKRFYESVNNASHGNMVRIFEFFRSDNHYYIATEKIVPDDITMAEMPSIPLEDRLLLCRSLAFEMMNLHKAHIVHADLKATNILLKRTNKGKLIGKIIDFDAGFFEDDPPRYEDELGGDQIYLAPEACQFICGDSVRLSCKIDVFALGLLFHQYLTGKIPEFDTTEYDYAFDAVLDDQELILDPGLPSRLKVIISGMLEGNPEKRLSMANVYSMLSNLDSLPETDVLFPSMDSDLECTVERTYKDIAAGDNNSESEEDYWFQPAGDL